MTVKELIEKLEKEDPNAEVYTSQEEGIEPVEALWLVYGEYLVID